MPDEVLRPIAGPLAGGLSLMYGGVAGVVRESFRRGWRKSYLLPCKIVSVGNLTTGGTGKTPMVQALCRNLREKGCRVAVVSRGYGGSLSKVGAVVSDGKTTSLTFREAGDEPVLHARSLKGVPVLIGQDRVAVCQRACKEFGAQVIVLDDGFQYWRLRRDMDIVLVDATDPFGGERLLPAGNLREPLTELKRASLVVLTKVSRISSRQREQIERRLRSFLHEGAPVFAANHRPVDLRRINSETERPPLEWLQGREVIAVCALADGNGFVETVVRLGANVVESRLFPDHHRFTPAELADLRSASERTGAPLVTTEKDEVKWGSFNEAPAYALRIEMAVDDAPAFWSQLDALTAAERPPAPNEGWRACGIS